MLIKYIRCSDKTIYHAEYIKDLTKVGVYAVTSVWEIIKNTLNETARKRAAYYGGDIESFNLERKSLYLDSQLLDVYGDLENRRGIPLNSSVSSLPKFISPIHRNDKIVGGLIVHYSTETVQESEDTTIFGRNEDVLWLLCRFYLDKQSIESLSKVSPVCAIVKKRMYDTRIAQYNEIFVLIN